MTVIVMSRREIDRMQVLRDLDRRRITTAEAAQLMQLTRRTGIPAGEALSCSRAVCGGVEAPRQAEQSEPSGHFADGGPGAGSG